MINLKYKDSCLKRVFCKCLRENAYTRRNRKSKAEQKLTYQCLTAKPVRDAFEEYFEKSKENKMDLFDFYKVIEKCEVDVGRSCRNLYEQHFTSSLSRACCKSFCRRKRDALTEKHVETFDQIEQEKHQYNSKSKLATQDSLSKILLVYSSVI